MSALILVLLFLVLIGCAILMYLHQNSKLSEESNGFLNDQLLQWTARTEANWTNFVKILEHAVVLPQTTQPEPRSSKKKN